MPASPCMRRRCTAPTITISPSPASRDWRARCAPRSRSISAPRMKSRRPKARSAGERVVETSVAARRPVRAPDDEEDQMAVYSVFAPPVSTGEADAERFRFVRDGFSWGAFLFGPLWMIFRRLWLVLIIYLVVIAALTVGLAKLPIGGAAVLLVPFLIALFLGLEGSSLRRWTLRRRGWSDLGIVIGEDLEAAERRFFEAWVGGAT